METWGSGRMQLTRVLHPYSTWPVNHCRTFLLPPPPLSHVRARACTHTSMSTCHTSPPTYIPLYPSLTPPTLDFLDNKVKNAGIDLHSSATLKGYCDILGNLHICSLFNELCHLLNAKWAETRKRIKHGDCAAACGLRLVLKICYHQCSMRHSFHQVTSAVQHITFQIFILIVLRQREMHDTSEPLFRSTTIPSKHLYLRDWIEHWIVLT